MLFHIDQLTPNQVYHTMIQTMIPRPIAWVLSENSDQSFNLAPFSYFSPVCSDPALLMISIGKKPDGTVKDTRQNILERPHFVVHIAGADLAQEVTLSSATLEKNVSEVEELNLETTDFGFSLPRLAACPVAIACELYEVKPLGDLPQLLVFGRVKQIYVDDKAIKERNGRQSIDAATINPLGRLGGDEYWVGGEVLTIKRPL